MVVHLHDRACWGNGYDQPHDLDDLLERLAPVAKRLDCEPELRAVADIPRRGASYQRQRAVAHESGGDLVAVVDALVAELAHSLEA